MGKYDKEAEKILGRAAFTLLCTAASEDRIDEQKMRDIAGKLHPEVGGNHRRRGGRSRIGTATGATGVYYYMMRDETV